MNTFTVRNKYTPNHDPSTYEIYNGPDGKAFSDWRVVAVTNVKGAPFPLVTVTQANGTKPNTFFARYIGDPGSDPKYPGDIYYIRDKKSSMNRIFLTWESDPACSGNPRISISSDTPITLYEADRRVGLDRATIQPVIYHYPPCPDLIDAVIKENSLIREIPCLPEEKDPYACETEEKTPCQEGLASLVKGFRPVYARWRITRALEACCPELKDDDKMAIAHIVQALREAQ